MNKMQYVLNTHQILEVRKIK